MENKKSLLKLSSIDIVPKLSVRIPTVGEILEDEDSYYNITSSLTASPFQYMVQLDDMGIDYTTIISRKLLPDEAYYNPETGILDIYEKKYQQTEGSADEKPQTCGFKIFQFNKIGKAIGAKEVKYTYILSDWFKQPKYKDMLEYIRLVPGCDYMFMEAVNGSK